MQFFFIRHAQSANNLLFADTGSMLGRSMDPEITATGRRQVDYLVKAVRSTTEQGDEEYRFSHLYCSLMVRSIQTGLPLAEALGIRLGVWEDLHESGGIFLDDETGNRSGQPGASRAELAERYPGLIWPVDGGMEPALDQTGWWNRPFETPDQSLARARRFCADLIARHGKRDEKIAVISHGSYYEDVVTVLGELDGGIGALARLNNTGITRFDFDGTRPHLVYSNRTAHLPAELITQ